MGLWDTEFLQEIEGNEVILLLLLLLLHPSIKALMFNNCKSISTKTDT